MDILFHSADDNTGLEFLEGGYDIDNLRSGRCDHSCARASIIRTRNSVRGLTSNGVRSTGTRYCSRGIGDKRLPNYTVSGDGAGIHAGGTPRYRRRSTAGTISHHAAWYCINQGGRLQNRHRRNIRISGCANTGTTDLIVLSGGKYAS